MSGSQLKTPHSILATSSHGMDGSHQMSGSHCLFPRRELSYVGIVQGVVAAWEMSIEGNHLADALYRCAAMECSARDWCAPRRSSQWRSNVMPEEIAHTHFSVFNYREVKIKPFSRSCPEWTF